MLTRRRMIAAATVVGPMVVGLSALPLARAGTVPAPKDAYLYIIWPNDGEVVRGAFWCRFGLRNMGVAPAGVVKENAGHHHLLIDTDASQLDMNEPIPADRTHVHFGAGQTETRLELPPGRHTLQLVLGDADHIPFNPPVVSRKITITVQ
jgi:hypothetical protein